MTIESTKTCIFCHASGPGVITKEHVWPHWLLTQAKVRFDIGLEVARINGEPTGKARQAKPFTRKPKIVCNGCNTGWMHDLEERARPLLLPLLDGFTSELNMTGQSTVAAWIAKTCFTLSYAIHQAPPRIPVAHREAMAEIMGTQAPSGVGVLLGFDGGSTNRDIDKPHLASFSSKEYTVLPPGADRRFPVYVLFLRIHRLIGIVVGSAELPEKYGPIPHNLEGNYLKRLWPATDEIVRYPPTSIEEIGGFNKLADRPDWQ